MFSDHEWKDMAANSFMSKYGLTYEHGVAFGFAKTKKCTVSTQFLENIASRSFEI